MYNTLNMRPQANTRIIVKDLIDEYLKDAKLMQIATSRDNQPWACSVYFAYDKEFHLYWISKPTRRHSKEIHENEKVAGTIVLSHTPGDKVRGIQFQGVAKELDDKVGKIECMHYYAKRYGMDSDRVEDIIENRDGHSCYQITPKLFVLFDEVNFPDDPRQEYKL